MCPRILVVDDHHRLRETLRLVLEDAGYCVTKARDGQQALASIDADRPDLVLSDLQMPAMTGGELLYCLRRRAPGLRVVLMSADPRVVALGEHQGADATLVKPFDHEALLATITQLL